MIIPPIRFVLCNAGFSSLNLITELHFFSVSQLNVELPYTRHSWLQTEDVKYSDSCPFDSKVQYGGLRF